MIECGSAFPLPLSLPKPRRVVRSSEFRTIYQNGIRASSRHFVAFYLRHEMSSEPGRVGFTIPRAVGKAVVRNRIRRRMREACRAAIETLPGGWAIVFNPRRSVVAAPFADLCSEVAKVFARCVESSSSS